MSQSSQTSSLGFSQETLDMVFTNLNDIFSNQQQTGSYVGSGAPLAVQLSEDNMHEKLEMTLETVGIMKPDLTDEVIAQQYLGNQPFGQGYSNPGFQMLTPAQNGEANHLSFKNEPEIDGAITNAITPPPDQMLAMNPMSPPLIVSNTDYPGSLDFRIELPKEMTFPTKSAQWTYSDQLEKLFAKMKCMVPIKIGLKALPPPGSYIQVVIIFKQPEHYRDVAERCPNHITKHKDGHPAPMHIMRCENPQTKYSTCQRTGRHYLTLPVSQPAAGTDFYTEMFQFMCFTSCPGGPNRRPVQGIFTLEYYGQVLGRRAVNLRICACPGRDRGIEENSANKRRCDADSSVEQPTTPASTDSPSKSEPNTPTTPAPPTTPPLPSTSTEDVPKLTRKRSNQYVTSGFEVKAVNVSKKLKVNEDDEIFTIQVKGREKYEILLKIKESFDLMELLPQAQIDTYRTSCAPCGASSAIHPQQNSESQQSTDSTDTENVGTPPSSFPMSQLSNGSNSGKSQGSQGSQGSQSSQQGGVASAVRFTLRRTVSLERKGYH